MKRTSFEAMTCSVARTLDVVGEWWTLLIIRDAYLGVTRFEEFQRRLGIARNVLTARLDRLVDEGILERRAYQERPVRSEYVLTRKGEDLLPVLDALRVWGDRYAAPDGPPAVLVHDDCGQESRVVHVCSKCREPLRRGSTHLEPGPGAKDPTFLAAGRPRREDSEPANLVHPRRS
ncbi:MAG TPA: helix-turn-helix domain-containing protein [Acidimicrobiales bacterium]|nr:helix-turn-helix domain-containing protein [Acidimicrobiales bacterium]